MGVSQGGDEVAKNWSHYAIIFRAAVTDIRPRHYLISGILITFFVIVRKILDPKKVSYL